MKPGRNDPCTCGSGKKYKKCCGSIENPEKNSKQIPQEVIEMIKKKEREQLLWEEEYGKVRPMIHTGYKDRKFVAVGSEIHHGSNWNTFVDFLTPYLGSVLGGDWGNNELKKPYKDRHQVLKWYVDMCHYQALQEKDEDGLYSCIPNGAFAAYINLAYDLYILRHHSALQAEIIRRLKISEQFQGARYELFAAATCIRAGFDIEYENEKDRSKKHPEFIGVHKITGQKVSVEAKSRHRHGVLDFKKESGDENFLKASIGKLLNRALQKPSEYPYIIFIDINLPPLPGQTFDKPWFKEIQKTIDRVAGNGQNEPDKFNLIMITNHPHHYGGNTSPDPSKDTLGVFSKNPAINAEYPDVIKDIFYAALKYGNIPKSFTEE